MDLSVKETINCNGKIIDLSDPIVMGILNVTPDSFSDGGQFSNIKEAVLQAKKMRHEGATIIDVGGMSSRPGSEIISIEEELNRVIPVIQALVKEIPDITISIDTVHAVVAQEAINTGASIINDISAGNIDHRMFETVATLDVPYILMHMQGSPKDMQDKPSYNDVVEEIIDFCVLKNQALHALGVKDIIIDPGFGFGKTIEDNYKILKRLNNFNALGKPILAGVSRKSMIYKVLDCTPKEAINGTTALNMLALNNGAKILRVHDVKEAIECIKLYKSYIQ